MARAASTARTSASGPVATLAEAAAEFGAAEPPGRAPRSASTPTPGGGSSACDRERPSHSAGAIAFTQSPGDRGRARGRCAAPRLRLRLRARVDARPAPARVRPPRRRLGDRRRRHARRAADAQRGARGRAGLVARRPRARLRARGTASGSSDADGSGERRIVARGTEPGLVARRHAASPSPRGGDLFSLRLAQPHDPPPDRDASRPRTAPAWSPDGRRVAYADETGVHLIGVADRPPLARHRDARRHARPVWSPDGARIAFERGGAIWLVVADGTGQRRLAAGRDAALAAAAAPTGAAARRRRAPADESADLVDAAAAGCSASRRRSTTSATDRSSSSAGAPPGSPTMQASQRVTLTPGRYRSYPKVGLLHYQSVGNHHHWHFQPYERYELRSLDGTVLVRDHKQGFCLADHYGVAPGIPHRPPVFLGNCAWGDPAATRARRGDVGRLHRHLPGVLPRPEPRHHRRARRAVPARQPRQPVPALPRAALRQRRGACDPLGWPDGAHAAEAGAARLTLTLPELGEGAGERRADPPACELAAEEHDEDRARGDHERLRRDRERDRLLRAEPRKRSGAARPRPPGSPRPRERSAARPRRRRRRGSRARARTRR